MAQLSEELLAEIRAELAGPGPRERPLLRGAQYPPKGRQIKALADMKAGRPYRRPAPAKPDPDNTFDALCREVGVAVRGDYFTQEEYEDARA